MYIVESRAKPRAIRVYDVVEDGTKLANSRIFGDIGEGAPDGFRCDVAGNLWCGWGPGELNGVAVFGGRSRNRLFMAASQSLYAVYVNTEGAAGG